MDLAAFPETKLSFNYRCWENLLPIGYTYTRAQSGTDRLKFHTVFSKPLDSIIALRPSKRIADGSSRRL
jgi:hypothetical protein